jgi:uncharacterized protein (UPF0332 family)
LTEIEIQALLNKAERAIGSAETELRAGNLDFAASRAYYACFYVAQALLLTEDYRFSSHGKVIGQYGRIFARTEALDRSFHQLLLRGYRLRQVGDYAALAEVESDLVSELIQGGREFLQAAHHYLEKIARDKKSPGDAESTIDEEPTAEAEGGESGDV